jgi:glutaconate CoA-transferase subunit A
MIVTKPSRKNPDKLISLAEAAGMLPSSGCRLAFGGVTLYRRPFAFALELLRRFRRDGAPHELQLICFTAGIESDILVGAGMVASIRTCYFGLEIFGLAPHFTTAAGRGEIKIIEETEASLAFGLRAQMAGVGFMPSTAWQGTDLLKLRPDVASIQDPYSGETLTAFPAISMDVAVIHALKADRQGNAIIGGNQGVDRELALVSDIVIVTTEELADALDKADIIGSVVDAVVQAPHGAWPTSCHPLYPLDGFALLDYTEQAGSEGYEPLLERWLKGQG